MNNYTKGPWEYKPEHSQPELDLYRIKSKDGTACFLTGNENNAALIAAAPEMFEALVKLAEDPETPHHVADFILPILNKAKGS